MSHSITSQSSVTVPLLYPSYALAPHHCLLPILTHLPSPSYYGVPPPQASANFPFHLLVPAAPTLILLLLLALPLLPPDPPHCLFLCLLRLFISHPSSPRIGCYKAVSMLRSLKTVVFIYFWAFLQVSVLCTYNCANYKCANLVVTCITSYLKMFSI